eukprot:g62639.t1
MLEHRNARIIRNNARERPPTFTAQVAEVLRFDTIPAHTNLIAEGDNGQTMYFIMNGQLDVMQNRSRVKTLGPGSFVGEVSLLFGSPRTATVRTGREECAVYALERAALEPILEKHTACIDAIYAVCIDVIYGAAQETTHLKMGYRTMSDRAHPFA